MKLQYNKPAKEWTDALPIGGGRLGGMIYGTVEQEIIELNEDTLYSGAPRDWDNPEARTWSPVVRNLLDEGRYEEADEACRNMLGPYTQSYLPFGTLRIAFAHGGEMSDYKRELDLEEAVSRVEYRVGEAVYTREAFASFPDQVIVIRLTCSRPGGLNLTARLDSKLSVQSARRKEDGS
ncbi:glycoside hydrolase family 95 protein [Paenibacillus sp. P26]|nr:glycoside hydrolase family 95 protein [Paenibacillus sp. P26]